MNPNINSMKQQSSMSNDSQPTIWQQAGFKRSFTPPLPRDRLLDDGHVRPVRQSHFAGVRRESDRRIWSKWMA